MAGLARNTFAPAASCWRSRQILPIVSAATPLARIASTVPARCVPAWITTSAQLQRCHTSTSSKKPSSESTLANTILAQQRLRRPLSPHLTIYRPQITSVLSVAMRITGLAMSGAFCIFPIIYLARPYLGLDLSVASLAAAFGAWSPFVKVPIKFLAAWTFTFHCFNSQRFLRWDMAWGITNKQVARTGMGVVGASFLSAAILAMLT